jgi:AcrR family transcriptional regulator
MIGNRIRDRRVQKTRDLLRGALASLVQEMDYDAISVKQILDRANVGRSTFYMHYRDKDEPLASSMLDMLRAMQAPPAASRLERQGEIIAFSLPVFEHVQEQLSTRRSKMGSKGRAALHEQLQTILAEMIEDRIKATFSSHAKRANGISPDLLASFVASTFVLVLNWWVEGDKPLSAQTADDIFQSLVLPALAAAAK